MNKFFSLVVLTVTFGFGNVAISAVGPVGFEELEGFELGEAVDGVNGWSSGPGWEERSENPGGDPGQSNHGDPEDPGNGDPWQMDPVDQAWISDETAHTGTQSLAIRTEAWREIAPSEWGTEALAFFQFWIRPTAMDNNPSSTIYLDGAYLTYYIDLTGEGGTQPRGYYSANEGPLYQNQSFPIDSNGVAVNWLRVNMRINYVSQKWDLWVDGKLIDINMPLQVIGSAAAEPELFFVFGHPYGGTFLDDWSLSAANPLFLDSDADGMPDVYEIAHGLNPWIDDRDGDLDGDGISNIQEFLAGTSPSRAGPGVHVRFVDNEFGSDTNSGQRPFAFPEPANGPKATISGAISASNSGDTVAVVPGTGPYFEQTLNTNGKTIRLMPIGTVQINQ